MVKHIQLLLDSIIECAMEIKDYYKSIEIKQSQFVVVDFFDGVNKQKKSAVEKGNSSATNVNVKSDFETKNLQTALTFSSKELMQMSKNFKKQFKTHKIKARVRKKNGYYEIRCQIAGVRISASSKLLAKAKERFIEKINNLDKPQSFKAKKVIFSDYLIQWLESVKKPYVKENTYNFYLQLVNCHILPELGARELQSIKQLELQNFINKFTLNQKFRTAKQVAMVLSAVFNYAVSDELITRSPMERVKLASYEQAHGTSLTRAEESQLILQLKENGCTSLYLQAYCFLMYTGLRRSELSSALIDCEFIKCLTAKQRKGYKEKWRHIPISPRLKSILPHIDLEKIKKLPADGLTKHLKKFLPNHHCHDLRHTFITRCQECGITRELVSLWAGHAADSSITSTVYTHLEQNKQLQIEEMQKMSYILN